jgi:hypothetical protein
VSAAELLQFGKHPGKTNLTDVDSALALLRYLSAKPTCAIMKHNNPSGLAQGSALSEAYHKAYMADRVAAYGGSVVVNRKLDVETAREISSSYCEVVAAPDYEAGALELLASRKNLRIMRIPAMERLEKWALKSVPRLQGPPRRLPRSPDFLRVAHRVPRGLPPRAECVREGLAYKVTCASPPRPNGRTCSSAGASRRASRATP